MAIFREARQYRAASLRALPSGGAEGKRGFLYLQGSQVRPPGQSSSVRMSHSSGEHTHERALATASDSTTMPPKRSNGALILLLSLSTAVLSAVFLCALSPFSMYTLFSILYYPLIVSRRPHNYKSNEVRMSIALKFTLRDVWRYKLDSRFVTRAR